MSDSSYKYWSQPLTYSQYAQSFPHAFGSYGVDREGYAIRPAHDYRRFRTVTLRHPTALRARLNLTNTLAAAEYVIRIPNNPVAEKWINETIRPWMREIVSGALGAVWDGFAVASFGLKTREGGRPYFDRYGRQPLDWINWPYPEQVLIRLGRHGQAERYKTTHPEERISNPARSVIWTFGERRNNSPYGTGVIAAVIHLCEYWADILAHDLRLAEAAHKPNLILQPPAAAARDATKLQQLLNAARDNYMKPDGKFFGFPKAADGSDAAINVIQPPAGAISQNLKKLEYLDRQIIIAMLGTVKAFYDASDTGGTYNLAQVQAANADRLRRGILESLVPPIVERLLRPVLDHNFEEYGDVKLDFSYPDEVDLRAARAIIEKLIDKGDQTTLGMLDRLDLLLRAGFKVADGGAGLEDLARQAHDRGCDHDHETARRKDYAAEDRKKNPLIQEGVNKGRAAQDKLEDYYDRHREPMIAAIIKHARKITGTRYAEVAKTHAAKRAKKLINKELKALLAFVNSVFESQIGTAKVDSDLKADYQATVDVAYDRWVANIASTNLNAAAAKRRGFKGDGEPKKILEAGRENAASSLVGVVLDQGAAYHLELIRAFAEAAND